MINQRKEGLYTMFLGVAKCCWYLKTTFKQIVEILIKLAINKKIVNISKMFC
jgi:hypothetical protein